MDLALDRHLTDHRGPRPSIGTKGPTFKKIAISQMEISILEGHDTTNGPLGYTFHHVAKHLRALARTRAKHDEGFGPDID